MSSFTTPLIAEALPNGRNWKLHEEFDYHIGSLDSTEVIHVPAGFVTDFASTDLLQWIGVATAILYVLLLKFISLPSWVGYIFAAVILAAILITPYGRQSKAAVIHDFLYKNHLFSRAMSDLIFLEAMQAADTNKIQARLMYMGVRLGGLWAYYRHSSFGH